MRKHSPSTTQSPCLQPCPAEAENLAWSEQFCPVLPCSAALCAKDECTAALDKKKIVSQRWILKFKCWLVSSVNKSTAYTFNSTDLIQIKPYITTVMYCTGLLYYKAVLKQQEGFSCDPTLLFSSCKPHWRGCEISSCSSHCILVSSRARHVTNTCSKLCIGSPVTLFKNKKWKQNKHFSEQARHSWHKSQSVLCILHNSF